MTQKDAIIVIRKAATDISIDADLFQAICEHESSYDPAALKYEPLYRYLESPRDYATWHRDVATESMLQMCSYGFGQIMGGVCRQYGYKDDLLKMITGDPVVPCNYAARHLKNKLEAHTETDAMAAYNAGSVRKTPGGFYENQVYVDAVSIILKRLRAVT